MLIVILAMAAMTAGARPNPQVPPPPPTAAPPVQAPQAQPLPPATGTGLVMGRVLDAGTSKPIDGAIVGITVQIAPAGVGGGAPVVGVPGFVPQTVATGTDGVFVFSNLPKGTFMLISYAPGFSGFQSELLQTTQMVTVGEGEKINDVEVRFIRPAVVTGQIRDERGDGVEGITVSLVRINMSGGRRTLSTPQSVITDDRGVYRIAGVRPGDYGVCALFNRRISPLAAGLAAATGNADQRRTLSGSGAQSPSGSGYRVGDLVLISASSSRNVDPAPGEDGRLSVFTNACFPSAPSVQNMEILRLDSGEERTQVDMTLRVVQTARVSGTLAGPANRLSGMAVNLYPAVPAEVAVSGVPPVAQTVTDPDGGWGFVGVPQGSYIIRVVYSPQAAAGIPAAELNRLIELGVPVTPEMLTAARQNTVPDEPTLWATAEIAIGDTDINGITLSLREGTRATGSIVFDGSKERPAANRFTSNWVGFEPVDTQPNAATARAPIGADGTFAAPSLVPGRYIVRPNFVFPGWTIKSITVGGRNVIDDPLDIGSSDVSGVMITMTDRPTEVSGTVRTSSGQPDPRARVVVFPSDRERWTQVNAGRRLTSTNSTPKGAFSFSGLPAGDYFVAAISDRSTTNWQDPKVLEVLSRSASLLSLRDGDRRTVDVVTSVVR